MTMVVGGTTSGIVGRLLLHLDSKSAEAYYYSHVSMSAVGLWQARLVKVPWLHEGAVIKCVLFIWCCLRILKWRRILRVRLLRLLRSPAVMIAINDRTPHRRAFELSDLL